MILPTGQRYTHTAVGLHWLIALLIFGLFPVGLYMVGLPLSPQKLKLYAWHKWTGITIFLLAVLRILWRARHAAPAPPQTTPAWQHALASAIHLLLYVLVLAIPLSGWVMSSALGVPVVYFGVLQLPDLVGRNKELGEALKWLHSFLNYAMAALVAVHAAAALKHHLVDRDDVLVRMIPFLDDPAERGR